MAMFVGPTKEEVLEMLREDGAARACPITLGDGSPQAVIDVDGATWIVAPLILNRKAAREAESAAKASGRPWIPSMKWQFLEPGMAMIRADSAPALADKLATMQWSWS